MYILKTCTRCGTEKIIDDFERTKNGKDGHYNVCRQCRYKVLLVWKENNRDVVRSYGRKWAANNKKDLSLETKEERERRLEKHRAYNAVYRDSHRKELNERKKTQDFKDKNNEYVRAKTKTDSLFRFKERIRGSVKGAFDRTFLVKGKRTFQILGAEIDVARKHIENLFSEGMTWDNMGEWHIDHKIPLAAANNEDEVIKLCHYTNLQPLWAKDNLSKGDKYNEQDKLDFLSSLTPINN